MAMGTSVETVESGPADGAVGSTVQAVSPMTVVGTYTVDAATSGPFMVWMTESQGDVVRRALDEWRYTIAASHADNEDALVVIGQIDERLGK